MPNQVSKHWRFLEEVIRNSLSPFMKTSDSVMNSILLHLLDGSKICWISCQREEEEITIDGVFVVTILEDSTDNSRNLLVYSVFAFDWIAEDFWDSNMTTLKKFAESKGCENVIGYSNLESIKKITMDLGGNTDYFVCMIPV